jgi:hypothetical protein
LSGYGASLDIKKADYLAIDDRPVDEEGVKTAEPTAKDASESDEVELVPLKAAEILGAFVASKLFISLLSALHRYRQQGRPAHPRLG